MALGEPTYGSAVLRALGIANVAAADGRLPGGRSRRGPRRGADLVIAPSEPYPFAERHRRAAEAAGPCVFVDGRDLLWWGARTRAALAPSGDGPRLTAGCGRLAAMATTRSATTHWEGSLMEGAGQVTLESSGLGTYDVTWAVPREDPNGRTSPEELIAAAHSSCFSMALSHALAKAGTPPERARHLGRRHLPAGRGHHRHPPHRARHGPGPRPPRSSREAAEAAKANCPVSKALTGTTITLDAALA